MWLSQLCEAELPLPLTKVQAAGSTFSFLSPFAPLPWCLGLVLCHQSSHRARLWWVHEAPECFLILPVCVLCFPAAVRAFGHPAGSAGTQVDSRLAAEAAGNGGAWSWGESCGAAHLTVLSWGSVLAAESPWAGAGPAPGEAGAAGQAVPIWRAALSALQQWLCSLVAGVAIAHLSFHRQFGTSLFSATKSSISTRRQWRKQLCPWILRPLGSFLLLQGRVPYTSWQRQSAVFAAHRNHSSCLCYRPGPWGHMALCSLLGTASLGWDLLESDLTV